MSEIESLALRWASEHRFWSTHITDLTRLRRHLTPGRPFRAQFLQALHGDGPASRAPTDPHAAFWWRVGRTAPLPDGVAGASDLLEVTADDDD